MTIAPADLAAMPRRTPTGIAEARYAETADRRTSRRFPVRDGIIPDPRATWRATVDRELMKRIIGRAFADHALALVTLDTRARVAGELLADVDRRCPPADMAVLARHGLTHDVSVVTVALAFGTAERFMIPPRALPIPRTGLSPQCFTMVPAHESLAVAPVPPAARPVFELIEASKATFVEEFQPAGWWPAEFKGRHRRPPTWAEIEAAWPRIGAWLAMMRER